ncbi:short chain dehydrogenase [Terrimonas sp. NA20]|uniref:Short chain dehydrogenase n=1 Tax=Terrimonas ginsenosidimutans TaxID=2908004 RepID=A0ABS9KUE2_9BACT|nr:short chain dehydrogenase [Terrimonas ginsenosidimutans]MCG2615957.1 short chain dehydrogenase [Terrimonas ginsenosidimutans]
MKIIIVGASGTIGKQIVSAFEKEHEVIRVGSKSGDIQADITDPASLENMFRQLKSFDALVSATGAAYFGPWEQTTDQEYRIGVNSKLMGQVNLVLIGQHYINQKGSFTLTSGILSNDPVRGGSNASMVNGAINSFVKAASVELKDGVRINAVSPNVVEDSPEYFPFFPGEIPVAMKEVTAAYVKSVLGAATGKVLEIH